MSRQRNTIQGVIQPGPNGFKSKVVKPTVEQLQLMELQGDSVLNQPGVANDTNVGEIEQTVRSNYVTREMAAHGGKSDAFVTCFSLTAFPKLRSTKVNDAVEHKSMKSLKNRCSKLILACTRMRICAPYYLLPAKRLNAMPEFDSIC